MKLAGSVYENSPNIPLGAEDGSSNGAQVVVGVETSRELLHEIWAVFFVSQCPLAGYNRYLSYVHLPIKGLPLLWC